MAYDEINKITTFDPYEEAKGRMVAILKQFRPVFLQELVQNPNLYHKGPYRLEVPKNHELLIGAGTTALVFELPNLFEEWNWNTSNAQKPVYLVGKCSFYEESEDKEHYLLVGHASGLDEGGLEKTIASLKNMGFEVPRMEESYMTIHNKGIYFTIMPDLRENGKFKVANAEDFNLDELKNGKELRKKYESGYQRIISLWQSGDYEIKPEEHRSNEGSQQAVKHIFLVQYAPHEEGRLVIADLNHLTILKRHNKK